MKKLLFIFIALLSVNASAGWFSFTTNGVVSKLLTIREVGFSRGALYVAFKEISQPSTCASSGGIGYNFDGAYWSVDDERNAVDMLYKAWQNGD